MSWTDLIAIAEAEDLVFRLEEYFHKVDIEVVGNMPKITIHGVEMDSVEAEELLNYLSRIFCAAPAPPAPTENPEELDWKEGLILDQLISEENDERTESAESAESGNGTG